MNYITGEKIMVGDKVRIAEECYGKVVCSIDDNEYSEEYPEAEWSYLKTGVLVYTEEMGIVHYPDSDENLLFIKRKS